ncbi:MAG TPA: hypothetical protein VMJ13_08795, partial [Candidatus Acidoferrum sp.]|nr:hypothetical protein [Candidatus Acidoferrum sp.]
MRDKTTPFQYLLQCSQMSLEDFELARLDRAASLRKQLRDIAEEWVEAEVEAQLARWVRENRGRSSARTVKFQERENELGRRPRALPSAPRIAKPKRPALVTELPAPVPISTRLRSPRAPSRPALAPAPREQREPRPDAFAAVRY